MEISKKNIGNGSVLITIKEELDLYGASDFRIFIEKIFIENNPRGIVISLGELSYLDSSGVGVLLFLVRRCHKEHCLLIFCEIKDQCHDVIQMTQLHKIFQITETQHQALQRIHEALKKQNTTGKGPILIDERHPNMDSKGLHYKRINIDFKRIRYISHVITQTAPLEIREHNLLEQQISEIIKNAVRHGNRNDISKHIDIWWSFSLTEARLIVEDQGRGFQNLEQWNEFFHQRQQCFQTGNSEEMISFLSYRTSDSTPDDGGNALFAAMEFWNGGYIMNKTRTKAALRRIYQ